MEVEIGLTKAELWWYHISDVVKQAVNTLLQTEILLPEYKEDHNWKSIVFWNDEDTSQSSNSS